MRKTLVMFLLALLPFQFVWGAAAEYCQHEGGERVSHFGHHVHKHHAQGNADGSTHGKADRKSQPTADDADCICCHLSCQCPLPNMPVAPSASEPRQAFAPLAMSHAGPFAAVIDRPKWAPLS